MQSNSLDSRAIGYTDTYGQRFMREGSFRYGVAAAPGAILLSDFPFVVEVADGNAERMTQHTVELTYTDKGFHPDSESVRIEAGDLVTWVCRDASTPPFEVVGVHDFFRSSRLVNESGYAHAFGTPGDYEWVDVYGSGIGGVVHVRQPEIADRESLAAWQKQLATGSIVMIGAERAEPAKIEIVTGQTVYFAVTKGPGISITDRRIAEVTGDVFANRHSRPGPGTRAAAD